ncbi:hypothetical protein WR25_13427 [Diploscapter pachys]|uniref:PAS domain-containing protein n=1 Tax=Diploscapter pachys TaxID=2018661 RepID=A0A2A2KGL2_9BILA|nr:hypothetical protein WR25_13427 [Diploscapter pachys]
MNGGVKVEDDLSECTSPPLLHGQNTASPTEDKLKEENEREEGATLSPPNTWTEEEQTMTEKVDSTQEADNRLLFIVNLSMPSGKIVNAQIHNDNINEELLSPGKCFFSLLESKGQSFLLSAAAVSSTKQQIFCRLNWSCLPTACELLCEFEQQQTRLTAFALRPAFGPAVPFYPVTFTTKHSSSCALSHIDKASIPYLGLLPTDLIGKSLLAFVYYADVHVVIKAHLDLHQSRGSRIVKSVAPLRLVAHNGAILQSQTEWHAYVNPWSKKIELVVARHKILGVPIGDSNVLATPTDGHTVNVLPSVMAKTFEEELRAIMNKAIYLIFSKLF